MKISTKGRYALRLMSELAHAGTGMRKPIREIAERQGISEKYLEQIVRSLVSEGLVRSVRGSQGGYELAADPDEITVGSVLRATEGELVPVCCFGSGDECDLSENCDTVYVWKRIAEAVNDVVDGITLEDLVNRDPERAPSVGLDR